MAKRKVLKVDYHRNGVGGYGFYVALIQDEDKSRKVAIRLDHRADKNLGAIACFVLDIDLLNKNIIGMYEEEGNAWRGDHYADVVDKAIEKRSGLQELLDR